MQFTAFCIATLAAVNAQAGVLPGLPHTWRKRLATVGNDEPCKEVSEQVAKWMLENEIVPKNITSKLQLFVPSTPPADIRPSLALACLKSMALHTDTALQHLDFLGPVVEWESTLDYLRDPPKGYLSEGVDVVRGLDDIAAGLRVGAYANEFEFLADLYHTQHGYSPSPVSTIDGSPAAEFLDKASVNARGTHDPDARFNGLLRSVANDANPLYYFMEPFTLGLPDTTTIKFQNGTVREFANAALVRANFSTIASGIALYNAFGQGNGTAQPPMSWAWYRMAELNYTTDLASYPELVVADPLGQVAGFLPDGPGFPTDVAVLTLNSFDGPGLAAVVGFPQDSLTNPRFANVTATFLRAAKAANRTKLVVDVQGNAGSVLFNLLFVYFSLFPNTTTTQLLPLLWQERYHPQLAFVTTQIWNLTANHETLWPFSNLAKPDLTPWSSPIEFLGPYPSPTNRGSYTHPAVENLSPSRTFHPWLPPFSTPPFAPEDIITVTDGQCGSACALFVEALTHGHGVRTVALGGRPYPPGPGNGGGRSVPMQAVGQPRGGPIVGMGSFPGAPYVNRSEAPKGLRLPPAGGEGYTPPLRVAGDGGKWGNGVTVNAANMLPARVNSTGGFDWGAAGEDMVPLQFRYEAATCRLYFTWDMARRIEAVWAAAAKAA